MLYRQEAPYLRYEQIPVSSTTYNYSPRHATQPTELKKHGILWFSIPHNHLAVEILRIVQGEVWSRSTAPRMRCMRVTSFS